MKNFIILLFTALLISSCTAEPAPGKQVRIDTGKTIITDYWLYLPENYNRTKSYPLILFLQGGSGNSSDPRASSNNGPVRFAKLEDLKDPTLASYVKDSFLIVNPHMTAGSAEQRQWHQYDNTILSIVNNIAKEYNADPSRLYITGLSKGAIGGYITLKNNPDIFAAGLFTAGSYTDQNIERTMSTPLFFSHNIEDDRVGIKSIEELITSYEALGRTFDTSRSRIQGSKNVFLRLPYEGHDSWTWTFSQPEVYEWLLNQRR